MSTELNLDKDNWKTVKLGEVAEEISIRVENPEESKFDKFVGLENFVSGDLKIKTYKTTQGLVSAAKQFQSGDILFARRNAYLRRASLVEFNGICSGDAFVLRENSDHVVPGFLAFVVNSDRLWNYANANAAGTMSKRVKWRDLANYEFLLPAKEQQAKIAELLWAMDEVIERDVLTLNALQQFSEKSLSDAVSGKKYDVSDWVTHKFSDLGESFGGLSGKSKDDFGEGSPFITYMNVFENSKTNLKEIDYVRIKDDEKQNCVMYGDILLTGSSETQDEVGISSVVLDNPEGFYLNSFCFGFRLYDFKILEPKYARFLMRGPEVRRFMNKHAQGSTRFNISKTTIKNKLNLLIPPINTQYKIIEELEVNERNLSLFEHKLSSSNSLQESLINRIF